MSDERLRTWLVTGASQGLGRAFTEAVLEAGEVVVATSRKPGALDDLKAAHGNRLVPLTLDVTDRSAVLSAFADTAELTGGIDVLVNNAGYGLAGGVEEVDEQLVRDQMDVNFFGMLWAVQGALPVMRRQGSGHIFQISSIAGITSYPNLSMYCASKWALEGMSETLAHEVEGHGIRVTLVQLGEFRTAWSADSMVRAEPMSEYDEVLATWRHGLSGAFADRQPGDPRRAAQVLLDVVDHDAPPLRLLLGSRAAELAPRVYQERLSEWQRWNDFAKTVDHGDS
ncbi:MULTISPECIES: SDR family NAD(P)-dependent oxidoreductase [unclassified Actinopolyspora]|uniref:SDR family NAD(P)-dependent oxidoreductase n=1 Tax=unclassified Actinopolyspora TaxID=2639451 RepID=UPI0013F62987|nr:MULTISPECIES: SDR family NAD(P)-dependent oxidoreductase [unclassified Actinopolyspora]NHD19341.1 SDR family NAD(P)-dependent oxidoreductase [Actinopolyspora sp. BKK2]NHE78465.1 SDR family NAD(P)-dependent oxidoreductase [Actinopolyspora sp. BKK1]